jgi:endoglucanase
MKKTIITMLCGLIAGCGPTDRVPTKTPLTDPIEFVKDMGAGWNLGNALDSNGKDETAWGNPQTSPVLIDAIAARGFKTLRIPVTWKNHMGSAPDYAIEEAWMNRVQEVVDYAMANEMYVILNTHHEAEWAIPTYEHVNNVTNHLAKVWTQIANHFQ